MKSGTAQYVRSPTALGVGHKLWDSDSWELRNVVSLSMSGGLGVLPQENFLI